MTLTAFAAIRSVCGQTVIKKSAGKIALSPKHDSPSPSAHSHTSAWRRLSSPRGRRCPHTAPVRPAGRWRSTSRLACCPPPRRPPSRSAQQSREPQPPHLLPTRSRVGRTIVSPELHGNSQPTWNGASERAFSWSPTAQTPNAPKWKCSSVSVLVFACFEGFASNRLAIAYRYG